MIEYIQSNIHWIKDVGVLLLSGTATVIAVLTYLKAKNTLLQPLRSEVTKKQTDILASLLEFLGASQGSFDHRVDYVGLVQLNVIRHLERYGFLFADHKVLCERLKPLSRGFIYCGSSNQIDDVVVVQPFVELDDRPDDAAGKERYEEAKHGNIAVDRVFLTAMHTEFVENLRVFADNPFLPVSIQTEVASLAAEISSNLVGPLKQTLESFVCQTFEKHQAEDKSWNGKFDPIGVYNEFNHARISHKQAVSSLRVAIREYLRIDSMP